MQTVGAEWDRLAKSGDERVPLREPDRPPVTRSRFKAMRREASLRGLVVTITAEQHASVLASGECHYCGCGLAAEGSALDRKDPRVGYTPENVVAACASCNKAKLTHDYETWKRIADAYVEKHGRGTMWPSAPRAADGERRQRAKDARTAYGIACGIQALALWAARSHDRASKAAEKRARSEAEAALAMKVVALGRTDEGVAGIARSLGVTKGYVSSVLRGATAAKHTGLPLVRGGYRKTIGSSRLGSEHIRSTSWPDVTRDRIKKLGVMYKDVCAMAGCTPGSLSNLIAGRGRGSCHLPRIDAALDELERQKRHPL